MARAGVARGSDVSMLDSDDTRAVLARYVGSAIGGGVVDDDRLIRPVQ